MKIYWYSRIHTFVTNLVFSNHNFQILEKRNKEYIHQHIKKSTAKEIAIEYKKGGQERNATFTTYVINVELRQ